MSTWKNAHLGAEDSVNLTVRVTEEEKQRLEDLRRAHGLTSKAQVIRAALDLLELANTPGTFLIHGRDGVRRSREEMREIQRRMGLLEPEPGEDADGLPGGAATGAGS